MPCAFSERKKEVETVDVDIVKFPEEVKSVTHTYNQSLTQTYCRRYNIVVQNRFTKTGPLLIRKKFKL